MMIVIKPTDACNGTCRYCAADYGAPSRPMDADRLPALFGAFAEWRGGHGEPLHWLWHGGEPMLMGIDFYRRVLAEQQRVFANAPLDIANSMQSNLSLLTDEWIPVLGELLTDGHIGTSFDVVPGWRGLGGGLDYDERWLRSVELLSQAGIGHGVVYVVHRDSLGRAEEIYRFLRNHDSAAPVRFNPTYAQGRAGGDGTHDQCCTPEEYGTFLVELLDAWLADGMSLRLAPLREWLAAWRGDTAALCCDCKGDCAQGHLGVTSDGDVYGCGRCVDSRAACYGNIFRDPLDAILAHPSRARLAERSSVLLAVRCSDCEWWDVCGGGCPNDGLIAHGDMMRETGLCAARIIVFERFRELFGPRTQPDPAGSKTRRPRAAALGREEQQTTPVWSVPGTLMGMPEIRRVSIARNIVDVQGALGVASDGSAIVEPENVSAELLERFDGRVATVVEAELSDASLCHIAAHVRDGLSAHLLPEAFAARLLRRLTRSGVPVHLRRIDEWHADDLVDSLEYYLTDPELETPIEPWDSMAEAVSSGTPVDLWTLSGERLGGSFFVDEDRRVTLSERLAELGRFFGTLDEGLQVWERSDLWSELAGLRRRLFLERSPCAFCEVFLWCGGYFAGPPARATELCATWQQLIARLQRAFRVARTEAIDEATYGRVPVPTH